MSHSSQLYNRGSRGVPEDEVLERGDIGGREALILEKMLSFFYVKKLDDLVIKWWMASE
ncbi:hypothetical protein SK128_021798, partial [Halocaridina rubra]